MKIAFVGDSFCGCHGPGTPVGEDRKLALELGEKYGVDWGQNIIVPDNHDQYDWPDLVTRHFNAEPTYCGLPGASFYQSFNVYQQKKRNEDIIIFCLTEPLRLTNKHKLPINGAWLDDITGQDNFGKFLRDYTTMTQPYTGLNNEELLEIAVNTKYYSDNVMDPQGAVAMHKSFVNYVDQIMVEESKKCIWFNSFNEHEHSWMKPFIPRSGLIGDTSLYYLTNQDREQFVC